MWMERPLRRQRTDWKNICRRREPFVDSPADSQEVQGNQFFKIYDEQQLEYILIVGGAGENIYMIGKMAAFQIQNLLVAYKRALR